MFLTILLFAFMIFAIALKTWALFALNKLNPSDRKKWAKTVLWAPFGAFRFFLAKRNGEI